MERILFFCIAAAALCGAEARPWQCHFLDKWDVKTYQLDKEDFCESQWNAGKTGLGRNSKPTCDEKIAPTVTFYVEGSRDPICGFDMNQGRGWEYNKCLADVKATANQGGTGGACYDYDTNCAYWASVGYCNTPQNSAYMLNYCQYSCNVCNTGGEAWIVYLAHGFTDDGVNSFFPDLRTAFSTRYATTGRKVIFAEVNWSHGSMGDKTMTDQVWAQFGLRMSLEHKGQGNARKYTPEERKVGAAVPMFSCSKAGAQAGYLEAASNTMVVGHLLGLLTADIVNLGISNLKTMCVGHSLGGHVCGFTGKTKQLDAIVGLDTAGPIFEENSAQKRLNKGDAKVVYSIHFNSDSLGIKKAVGDYDIYVNGGKNQPGCGSNMKCSHSDFTHGFMKEIWTYGPCIFGKIVPELGDTSPGTYTKGRHDVRSTDRGCEFTLEEDQSLTNKVKGIFG